MVLIPGATNGLAKGIRGSQMTANPFRSTTTGRCAVSTRRREKPWGSDTDGNDGEDRRDERSSSGASAKSLLFSPKVFGCPGNSMESGEDWVRSRKAGSSRSKNNKEAKKESNGICKRG